MGFRHFISTISSTNKTSPQETNTPQPSKSKVSPNKFTGGTYNYTPFVSGTAQIRLLQLLPGSRRSQIDVSIETVSFGPRDRPGFEALSYTWGPEGDHGSVHVVGTSGSISVRQNLLEALYSLRLPNQPRCLWIDAICIDQNNLAERSEQVNVMARMYARAARVIAWIGTESATSVLALRSMNTIGQHTLADWGQPEVYYIGRREDRKHRLTGKPLLDMKPKEISAMLELLSRSYFSRLWVYQEVHLGADHAVLVCGQSTIPWDAVRRTVLFLQSNIVIWKLNAYKIISTDQWRYLRYLCDSDDSRRDFLDCLHRTRLAHCTDDRDRVFSVLSMLTQGHNLGLSKTYDPGVKNGYLKTEATVYHELITTYIGLYQNLEFLNYIGQPKYQMQSSWVPDWSVNDPPAIFKNVRAAPNMYRPHIKLEKSNPKLRVGGLIIGRVVYSSPALELPPQFFDKNIPRDIDDLVLERLTRVLYGNNFAETNLDRRLNPIKSHSSLSTCKQQVLSDLAAHHNRLTNARTRYTSFTPGRSLLVTADLELGLGPAASQVKDLIAVFPGCSAAIVLRPVNNKNRYKVIGPGYIDKYMACEAFLGPLPQGVKQVTLHDPGEKPKIVYFDEEADDIELEDPRLGDLPQDWRKTNEGRFENLRTGEQRNSEQDPRLDMDRMQRRFKEGVSLREFELV